MGNAVAYVKEGKLCINLTPGFARHLQEYEALCQINVIMSPLHCSVLQQGFEEGT